MRAYDMKTALSGLYFDAGRKLANGENPDEVLAWVELRTAKIRKEKKQNEFYNRGKGTGKARAKRMTLDEPENPEPDPRDADPDDTFDDDE